MVEILTLNDLSWLVGLIMTTITLAITGYRLITNKADEVEKLVMAKVESTEKDMHERTEVLRDDISEIKKQLDVSKALDATRDAQLSEITSSIKVQALSLQRIESAILGIDGRQGIVGDIRDLKTVQKESEHRLNVLEKNL